LKGTCIIVSPYFPPSTLAAVHRARHLAKHLPAAGWKPVVVCVDEAYHEERPDPGLAALVPGSVEIVKVGALSPRVCRPLGFGEISVRAWRSLRHALMRLLQTRPVGAVLITGSPYYPMLLAAEIKRRFGVPVVLDFQDPWVSTWGAKQSRLSKRGVSHQLSVMLEPKAIRAADFITSVSEPQNAEMRARYPWLDANQMAAIPIGGDPEDFQKLRILAPEDKLGLFKPGAVTFCYVGTFMPRTGPLMEVFFKAFAIARRKRPVAMERVNLVFVGTSNQPNDMTTFTVIPLAEQTGVADAVREVPQRVPFLEAIGILARADGILLIGSDEPHYTASKIYPGLMAQRPFLSLFHGRSSSHEILTRAGGGVALAFDEVAALPELVTSLADAIIRLSTAPGMFGRADPAVYHEFTAARIALRYAEIFDRLAARYCIAGNRLHA
jgi:glycosyltransferase involved in cell wall biosynthesis